MVEFDIHEIYGKTRCSMAEGVIVRSKENDIEIRIHCDGKPGVVDFLLRFAQFLFPEKEPVTEGDKKIKEMFHEKVGLVMNKYHKFIGDDFANTHKLKHITKEEE